MTQIFKSMRMSGFIFKCLVLEAFCVIISRHKYFVLYSCFSSRGLMWANTHSKHICRSVLYIQIDLENVEPMKSNCCRVYTSILNIKFLEFKKINIFYLLMRIPMQVHGLLTAVGLWYHESPITIETSLQRNFNSDLDKWSMFIGFNS